jgi:hypothetical protein
MRMSCPCRRLFDAHPWQATAIALEIEMSSDNDAKIFDLLSGSKKLQCCMDVSNLVKNWCGECLPGVSLMLATDASC